MKLIDKLKLSGAIAITTLGLNLGTVKAMEGLGTQELPYQITNLTDLQQVNNSPSSYYILDNNINAYSTKTNTFQPIQNFSGNFEGDNYSINDLYINQPDSDHIGLFSKNSGEIKNLSLNNINLIGNNYVGALVGENNGIIINCNSNGEILGYNSVGGLVGWNKNQIKNSYSKANIKGDKNGEISYSFNIGGLVGWNWDDAIISNCYATGNTISYGGVGGFVGFNDGGILNSYSKGNVQGNRNFGGFVGFSSSMNYQNCFWDTEISGQTKGPGTPLTTSQMKDPSNFTNWDFQNIWKIIPDQTYPFLNENNQFLNQAPIFYGVFVGENQIDDDENPIHRFGDDAQALYNVFIPYTGIDSSNLIHISANNLEAVLLETIDKINPKDKLFIYYSGHGYFRNDGSEPEIDNSKEVDRKSGKQKNTGDEYLIYGDQSSFGSLKDDTLKELLSDEKLDKVSKMVILDCCMSGGFWGKQGNESDIGDLDKLNNIGFISACEEGEFSYSYPSFSANAGRGIFSYDLTNKLTLNENGISPADTNRDGTASFNEICESLKQGYPMQNGDVGVIRTDPNTPWLNSGIEITITDHHQIPEPMLGLAQDFDSTKSINTHMPGDLFGNNLYVNLQDFAKLSSQWMRQDCSPENNWCDGADINKDEEVNYLDLKLYTENYLDPEYYEED